MKILFTTNDMFASKAIRSITDEPMSHTALEFPSLGVVIHSNTKGVHIESSSTFRKNNRVVIGLSCKDMCNDQARFVEAKKLLEEYEFNGYDYGAFFYLGIHCIIRAVGRKLGYQYALPPKNLWQHNGLFLCTEWVAKYIGMEDNGMLTAYGLYCKLLKSGKWSYTD